MAAYFPYPLAIFLLAAAGVSLAAAPATRSDASRPVIIGNRFVNPVNGKIVGRIAGASPGSYASPVPGDPGKFRIGPLLVDVATRTVTTVASFRFPESSSHDPTIVRLDEGGRARWSHPFDSLRGPAMVTGNGIVVIAGSNELFGISDASGGQIWHAAGPSERLVTAHGLVVAVQCGSHASAPGDPAGSDNLVMARRLSDGSEVWRARMPMGTDPSSTLVAGDLFLVRQFGWGPLGDRPRPLGYDGPVSNVWFGWTRAFAIDGALRFHLDSEAVSAAQRGGSDGDTVVVTDTRTARLNRDGRELWRLTPRLTASDSGAGTHPFTDGSLLVESHDTTSDSGVEFARIESATGAVVWRIHAEDLGVGHFGYWQGAYVELRGTEIILVSQAIGGYFVERRRASSGALIGRWRFLRE